MRSSTNADTETAPAHRPPSRFLPGARPRLIAHRGLALDGAENTMRAFHDALAAGATMLETDTRATADGIALAIHDATLLRIADDTRRVDTLTRTDLPSVRVAGIEPLATLEDVLGTYTDVPVNVDVKDAHAIGPAVDAIARTGAADRICLTSFDQLTAKRAVDRVREATGVRPVRSPSRAVIATFVLARALELPPPVVGRLLAPYGALQVPLSYRGAPVVTDRAIAAAHRSGAEVHVWTIDDPRTMTELLAIGADGIVTNRVDVLAELLGNKS